MATKKSSKKKATIDRSTDRLFKAVASYVEERGGKVLVIGGVEIQEWPLEGELKFRIAVRCTGKRPELTHDNS